MKLSWRVEVLQLIIIATMFAVAAWVWPYLPERLPVHWNIKGEVDAYGGKFVGLLLLPLTVASLYVMLLALPRFDPGRRNYENFGTAFTIIRLSVVLFMALLYAAVVLAAFGCKINMTSVVMPAVGVLFIVLGNFMGKIRPNWFIGVRTPWTLSSKLSWDKTHRLAGWLFILMGLLMAVVGYVQTTWMLVAMLIFDGACLAWMVIYSYLVYRSDPNRTSPAGTSSLSE